MILPLANRRDKVTQVKWGIRDFASRFGRSPEGMWMPETAVDTETLEVLAENGIKFTILAQRQAKRVRLSRKIEWQEVSEGRIDPSRAYVTTLPSKKKLNLFFYDGPISQAVAFEGILNDGKRFAERVLGGFSETRKGPQLVHIATDGESYGHHHHFGEMALSYALHHIEETKLAELTNYGEFLEKHPPRYTVEIVENSSWSCVHGVERWRSNCGCNSGGHPWNQEWRAPLRAALDWLRDRLAPTFEKRLAELLKDPWEARDDYIRVLLDRSDASRASFFTDHAVHKLSDHEEVLALRLLEMQRHAMLMYTSCGWFFDELSGLETVQVIQYAARAIQLAEQCCGDKLEPEFLHYLTQAKSNLPEHGDGAKIYEKWVKPAFVDIERVAAHYAISSLFENYGEKTRIYCYDVERNNYSVEAEGKMRLATGSAWLRSQITHESASLSFAVLHLGDHNLSAGVKAVDGSRDAELHQNLKEAFSGADTTKAILAMDQAFDKKTFSLPQLFRDEQRKIMNTILNESLISAAAVYRTIFESRAPLIRFLTALSIPVPKALMSAAEIALNSQLEQALQRPELDVESIRGLLKEAEGSKIALDTTTLEYAMRKRVEKDVEEFATNPRDPTFVARLRKSVDLIRAFPFTVTLWEVQNICYPALVKAFEENEWGASPDPAVQQYFDNLLHLAVGLHIRAPHQDHKEPGDQAAAAAGSMCRV
jgi:alpha-amylase/alpha-mannosidase (GH57 family)